MSPLLKTFLLGCLVAYALANGIGSATTGASAAQTNTRTIYVSVTAKDGSAVTDLKATEFEVKEGGKTAAIAGLKPSTAPLRVAVIDSDGGTGAFQQSIALFLKDLLPRAQFAVTSVIVQPEKVLDYSNDVDALQKAIDALGRRGRAGGASPQLMEAIEDAAKTSGREATRSVMLVMRIGGEANSTVNASSVRELLRKSGTILYVVSAGRADQRTGSTDNSGMGNKAAGGTTEQSQLHNDETTDALANLGQVIGDGAKESGGRHEQVVSMTMMKVTRQFADELLHEYALTYTVPAGTKPGDKIAVSSTRKGVTIHAPTRIPN